MNRFLLGVGVAALAISVVSTVSAGMFRDRFMNRSDAGPEAEELEQAEDRGAPVEIPAGVSVERDVAYGSDPLQRIDVYLPSRAEAAPVVFMVHGGAWMIGDKSYSNVVANKINRWVTQGFVLVSVNYRMSPQADPVEQANDVARALAFAQTKAKGWGADPARFVLMGHSAGAHLVSLLAADPAIAAKQGARPWLGTVALDSAAFDVQRIMEARHYRFYDRVFKDDPAYWRSASPTYRLASAGAPMMLVCSTRREVACEQARGFAEKATSLGRKISVYPIDATHREINQNLGLPGEYTEAVETFFASLGIKAGKKTDTQ
jgi:acetyl esterase/lipase